MSSRSAVLSCLAAACCVGASIAVTPFIAAFPVLAGQTARYTAAAAILGALLPRLEPAHRPRLTRGQLGRIVLAAATGSAGFNVLLVAASRRAEPAVIGAVVGASPVVLAVLGAPRGAGRWPRPRPRVLLGATAASAGVVVVHGGGHSTPAGLWLAVAVLACEVGFTLAVAPVLREVGPARVATWNCAVAAGLLAIASVVTGETLRTPTWTEAATLAYQGLVMTALAFVLWYRGVARLGADRAGTTMAVAPVAATLTAAAAGTGTLGIATAAGAGLAALGVVVAVRSDARRARAEPAPNPVSAAAPPPATAAAGGRRARRA